MSTGTADFEAVDVSAGTADIGAVKAAPEEKHWNVNKAVDVEHRSKSLEDIVNLPVSALRGLDSKADDLFLKLKIKSIKDLGEWKAYKLSQAIVKLSAFEDSECENLSPHYLEKGLDKGFRGMSLKALVDCPLSSIMGVAPWVDEELGNYKNIKTIKDLAKWKYANTAEQLVVLSKFGAKPR